MVWEWEVTTQSMAPEATPERTTAGWKPKLAPVSVSASVLYCSEDGWSARTEGGA